MDEKRESGIYGLFLYSVAFPYPLQGVLGLFYVLSCFFIGGVVSLWGWLENLSAAVWFQIVVVSAVCLFFGIVYCCSCPATVFLVCVSIALCVIF